MTRDLAAHLRSGIPTNLGEVRIILTGLRDPDRSMGDLIYHSANLAVVTGDDVRVIDLRIGDLLRAGEQIWWLDLVYALSDREAIARIRCPQSDDVAPET